MTSEELGESSFNGKKVLYKSSRNKRSYIDGFKDGLEAGKSKWHKVADGDLPKDFVHVLNEKGNKVMYDARERTWQKYSECCEDYVAAEQPVAWCEVPKFEEE